MNLTDTHAHLTDKRFSDDLDDVLQRAQDAGVHTIINVGYDLPSSRRSVQLAASSPLVYAAVGIHPHEAAMVDEQALKEVRQLAGEKKVVAIGEIGLDYYYNHASHERQHEAFRAQLRLAHSLALPVIIHDRDSHHDILSILQDEDVQRIGGVMHCFSGDTQFAAECLNLGLYISLAGPVTFKNTKELLAVAECVPIDRLLLETDAPYLAPVPYRGKRNEPAFVQAVAEKVAEIRQLTVWELAAQTTENAKKLFKLHM
jgi:TatD DNase family protein